MTTMHARLTGHAVFIRTVTSYFTGVLERRLEDGFLVLQDASWIATTARFGTMMAEGAVQGIEVEPYPPGLPVYVNEKAIVEICEWKHPLPREQT